MSENRPSPVVVLLAVGFVLCLIPGLLVLWYVFSWNPWAVAACIGIVVGFGLVITRIARISRAQD